MIIDSDDTVTNEVHCCDFCLLEVRAMVVAVQQLSAECTAIFTVYCLILLTSLCSDKTQKLHSSMVEGIPKQ